MADLGELLGQNQAATEILEALAVPGARLLRLTGPSGSGKSHIAFLAGATWRDDGGRCVIALGDDNHASRSLQPFLAGLASLPRSWTGIASEGSRSALRVADVVVGSAGAGASIFDLLSSTFRQRVERALRPFSSPERDIILDLKRLARSHPLLLIADNAHWWDADSLWLLRELVSDRLRTAVSQLQSVVVLLVDTAEEQRPSAPESFDSLVKMCERTWQTSRCTREQFPRVLKSLGMTQELPPDTLDALFAATGGHLKLAEQLALYAERHSIRRLVESDERAYVATLLSARVASLGTSRENMAALLSRAAVIGLEFDERDLLCLAEDLQGPASGLIELAEQISFLQRSGGRLSFSHDVIRSAILAEESPPLLKSYRKKFEECLSILRPGDYSARSKLLLSAGVAERGRELFALASIQQLRRGTPATRVLRQAIFQFPDDEALQAFVSMMASAYDSVASGDFTGPLSRLKTPLRGESPLMAAERNYLAALCCIELQTAAGIDEAASVLSSWEPSLRGEHEVRLRFLLLLQQAQVLAEMFDNARETERAIERKLLARSRYDHDAAVMLQVQNRRAAALNAPEVAELRIREAVAFSRRGPGDSGTGQTGALPLAEQPRRHSDPSGQGRRRLRSRKRGGAGRP